MGVGSMTRIKQKMSLASRGARYQTMVAAVLMSVLPMLLIGYVTVSTYLPGDHYAQISKIVVIVMTVVLAVCGYAILYKYPENIVKLRHYLKEIAEGELPEAISLLNSEDDLKAIEGYLNTVLEELRRKVLHLEHQLRVTRRMKNELEAQQKELLEAERHRVMIQSVAAACHHIGQPTTVLSAHLQMLRTRATSDKEREQIEACNSAVDSIAEVLDKLRRVSEYRTVPYMISYDGCATTPNNAILDIEPQGGGKN
ncbi:MAG: hypothetical protein BWX70_00499 [Verrucomicrobia bacterium ADurb.Bin070]|nr:MAG: hypothetical protein BWX70_00499 [Verrucomicrobia bacterium ADurb.Bin070]